MEHYDYIIYTDGSCRGNGKESSYGGWAYVVLRDGEIILKNSGGEKNTTNQRMELTAAMMACKELSTLDGAFNAILYSDSAYLINCKKQGWYKNWQKNGWKNSKKESVANPDLWQKLIEFFDAPKENFVFEKVKGHAGNTNINEEWNNYVDNMAQKASKSLSERS